MPEEMKQDLDQLERLAQAIKEGQPIQGIEAEEAMHAFECAATPKVVLGLISEIKALRKDAGRYRWLRRQTWLECAQEDAMGWTNDRRGQDEQIDRAMKVFQ